MMRRGVSTQDIIFANPCKSNESIKRSKKLGIDLMTFDNEEELIKIQTFFPEARLVLRIKVDDSESKVKLNLKYGADQECAEHLLKRAQELNLNIIGIAFHVGSSCQSAQSYVDAIKTSRTVFNRALDMGFQLSLVDIGGGFPGCDIYYYNKSLKKSTEFDEIASVISKTLDEYYPETDLMIMAEPGRYYCESAFTLIAKILSKKYVKSNDRKTVMYYLNDGIYGSFSDGLVDGKTFKPLPLFDALHMRNIFNTTLWGPTCDSADCIRSDFEMPEMFVGEWLMFEDMGAYSLPYSEYGFNGMPSPKFKVFVSERAEKMLMERDFWPKIKSLLADSKWSDIYCEKVWYQMG